MSKPWQTQLAFDFPLDLHRGEWKVLEPRVLLWDRGTSHRFDLDDLYAGHVFESPIGQVKAWVSLGWKFYSHTAESSYDKYLGEFATVAEAAAALENAARVARADPKYIWEPYRTPEAIKKSKANGWWRGSAVEEPA